MNIMASAHAGAKASSLHEPCAAGQNNTAPAPHMEPIIHMPETLPERLFFTRSWSATSVSTGTAKMKNKDETPSKIVRLQACITDTRR